MNVENEILHWLCQEKKQDLQKDDPDLRALLPTE